MIFVFRINCPRPVKDTQLHRNGTILQEWNVNTEFLFGYKRRGFVEPV